MGTQPTTQNAPLSYVPTIQPPKEPPPLGAWAPANDQSPCPFGIPPASVLGTCHHPFFHSLVPVPAPPRFRGMHLRLTFLLSTGRVKLDAPHFLLFSGNSACPSSETSAAGGTWSEGMWCQGHAGKPLSCHSNVQETSRRSTWFSPPLLEEFGGGWNVDAWQSLRWSIAIVAVPAADGVRRSRAHPGKRAAGSADFTLAYCVTTLRARSPFAFCSIPHSVMRSSAA